VSPTGAVGAVVSVLTGRYAHLVTTLPQATTETFRADILDAGVPVLVDFWAPWCGYCRAMTPIVEQLAGEYGPRLKVVAVNAEAHAPVAVHFAVRGLPTFLVVRDGQVRAQLVGAVTKARPPSAGDRRRTRLSPAART
jgi:thioredoxin 1